MNTRLAQHLRIYRHASSPLGSVLDAFDLSVVCVRVESHFERHGIETDGAWQLARDEKERHITADDALAGLQYRMLERMSIGCSICQRDGVDEHAWA